MSLPQRFKALREEAGLSQKALAQELGCDVATVSRIELGKCLPTTRTAFAYAAFFGVSAVGLLDGHAPLYRGEAQRRSVGAR